MFKILGTDDSINSCDCCGKSGLKHTVVVEINGEEFHYGSTCATKHTGLRYNQINKAIQDERDHRKESARKEFYSSNEYIQHQLKLIQLTKSGIRPGKEFHEMQKDCAIIAEEKKHIIASKFKIEIYSF